LTRRIARRSSSPRKERGRARDDGQDPRAQIGTEPGGRAKGAHRPRGFWPEHHAEAGNRRLNWMKRYPRRCFALGQKGGRTRGRSRPVLRQSVGWRFVGTIFVLHRNRARYQHTCRKVAPEAPAQARGNGRASPARDIEVTFDRPTPANIQARWWRPRTSRGRCR